MRHDNDPLIFINIQNRMNCPGKPFIGFIGGFVPKNSPVWMGKEFANRLFEILFRKIRHITSVMFMQIMEDVEA